MVDALWPQDLGGRLRVVALLVGLSALCALAPAAVYALSLATFGFAHVLAELRYLDGQFGPRLPPRWPWLLVGLLTAIFACRVVQIAGLWPAGWGLTVEMGLGTALVLLPLPVLAQRGILGLTGGIALGGLWVAGWIVSPVTTLLLFAVAHNFTPVGLLLDGVRPDQRPGVATFCALAFVGVPAALVAGAWEPVLGQPLPWTLPGLPLEKALSAYLPAGGIPPALGLRLFSAAVFTQCLHYACVLGVLPAVSTEAPRLPWPTTGPLIAASAVLAGWFAVSFVDARLLYSPFAAVHAWVEVPLLMFAVAIPKRGGAVTGPSRSGR